MSTAYSGPAASITRWLAFRNDSGEVVPPFALMMPTGFATVDDQAVATIDKCDETGYWPCYFNGPHEIPIGGYGSCTTDLPCTAYYDDAATPAVGEFWGAKEDSWKLTKNCPGYEIGTTGSDGRVIILPSSTAYTFRGVVKTPGATKGGTCTVFVRDPAGTTTAIEIPAVQDDYGDIDTDGKATLLRVGRLWTVVVAECPA